MSDREQALEDALANCLNFMVTEMHWEGFRADMLYPDHDPKNRESAENMRKLQNFLAQPQIKQYIKHLLP